jgi:hypothetical protein
VNPFALAASPGSFSTSLRARVRKAARQPNPSTILGKDAFYGIHSSISSNALLATKRPTKQPSPVVSLTTSSTGAVAVVRTSRSVDFRLFRTLPQL